MEGAWISTNIDMVTFLIYTMKEKGEKRRETEEKTAILILGRAPGQHQQGVVGQEALRRGMCQHQQGDDGGKMRGKCRKKRG